MEHALAASGAKVRVIEDCLNGRRTVWDDPFKPGRNGLQGLAQRIEMYSPLSLVIVLLSTNDFQSMHQNNAWHGRTGVGDTHGSHRAGHAGAARAGGCAASHGYAARGNCAQV